MGEITADGAAIADLRVRDVGQSLMDQRQVPDNRRIALEDAVAGQRTDANGAGFNFG